MRRIRARFPVAAGDRGMTLVEVMVAMFVFAIIATAVLGSLMQVLSTTRQSRAQHVAANLAAAEIELAHDTPDLFSFLDAERTVTIDGADYRVRRETSWVSASEADMACGAGGGTLRYKRVHVTVSWSGMREGANPVRADTVVNPAEQINDPAKGTVLVSVIDSVGDGVPSAQVSLTATSGGTSISPKTTDAQGCAYFLQVPPGIYDVSVAKTGYTGILEATPRQRDVSVQPGSASSVSLQYDRIGKLEFTFAPSSGARLPSNMPLSLVSTYGVRSTDLPSAATVQRVDVHPRVSYRVVPGRFQLPTGGECTALDPAAWPESEVSGEMLAPGAAAEVGVEPGATAPAAVPMGLVRLGSAGGTLRAIPATGLPEHPTCDGHPTLSYGSVSSNTVVAVPYGTWRFTVNGSNASVTPVSRGENLSSHTVVLDPREVAP